MNWWLAALEFYGLITREEALHIADNIKNTIHKDNYVDAYDELSTILGSSKLHNSNLLAQLQADVAQLKADHTTKTKPIALAKQV